METFLDVKDIMKVLKMSEASVRRLLREKKIPYYKIGGKILFRHAEIKEWLNKKKEGG